MPQGMPPQGGGAPGDPMTDPGAALQAAMQDAPQGGGMPQGMPQEMPPQGGMPGMPPGTGPIGGMSKPQEQFATPEQKQMLMELIEKTQGNIENFEAVDFASGAKSEEAQQNALLALMQILEDNGIDPADSAQVQEFMNQLAEQSPDLYDMFVMAMEGLLGQEIAPPEVGMEGGEGALGEFGAPEGEPLVDPLAMAGLPGQPPESEQLYMNTQQDENLPPQVRDNGGQAIPPEASR